MAGALTLSVLPTLVARVAGAERMAMARNEVMESFIVSIGLVSEVVVVFAVGVVAL